MRVVSVDHFHFLPLPANSLISSQLFSNNDTILSLVEASQIFYMQAGLTCGLKKVFKNLIITQMGIVQLMTELCWTRWGSRQMPPVLLWRTSQDKWTSLWDMRVCATAAEQHNKGVVTGGEGLRFRQFFSEQAMEFYLINSGYSFGSLKVTFFSFPRSLAQRKNIRFHRYPFTGQTGFQREKGDEVFIASKNQPGFSPQLKSI